MSSSVQYTELPCSTSNGSLDRREDGERVVHFDDTTSSGSETADLGQTGDRESLQLLTTRGGGGGGATSSTVTGVKSFWTSTAKQGRLILFSLFLVQLTDTMCISIMIPFFPKEAEVKGLSAQTIGWVFAVFPLVRFLFSPLCGQMLTKVGCKKMVVFGQAFTGCSAIAFGLLDYLDSSPGHSLLYTLLCFLFRILTALGSAAGSTAGYTIVSIEFKENYSQCYGILQSAIGLGVIIGPAVGGLLYAGGGFVMPFAVLGSVILVSVPLTLYCLPSHQEVHRESSLDCSKSWRIFRNAVVIVMGMSIINAAIIWSSLQPTLEPHLRQFQLNPALLGLVYFMIGAMYVIFSPIVGWIADKRPSSALPLVTVGFVLTSLCLLLIGPSPIFGAIADNKKFWLSLVSLAGLGMAASFAVVPCYNKILEAVGDNGTGISFALSSFIAGYYNSCWSFGEFSGPLVGAVLVEFSSFALANSILAVLCLVSAVVIVILHFFNPPPMRRKSSVVSSDSPIRSDLNHVETIEE